MQLPGKGGKKVCIFGPGHMTKMAAMLIYSKNLEISSSTEPLGRLPLNLVCSIWGSSTIKFKYKWWSWVDLDLFYGKVKFGPIDFNVGNTEKEHFFISYCAFWYGNAFIFNPYEIL